MPWFDAGVNLLDKRFDADEVIQRAQDAENSALSPRTPVNGTPQ